MSGVGVRTLNVVQADKTDGSGALVDDLHPVADHKGGGGERRRRVRRARCGRRGVHVDADLVVVHWVVERSDVDTWNYVGNELVKALAVLILHWSVQPTCPGSEHSPGRGLEVCFGLRPRRVLGVIAPEVPENLGVGQLGLGSGGEHPWRRVAKRGARHIL